MSSGSYHVVIWNMLYAPPPMSVDCRYRHTVSHCPRHHDHCHPALDEACMGFIMWPGARSCGDTATTANKCTSLSVRTLWNTCVAQKWMKQNTFIVGATLWCQLHLLDWSLWACTRLGQSWTTVLHPRKTRPYPRYRVQLWPWRPISSNKTLLHQTRFSTPSC